MAFNAEKLKKKKKMEKRWKRARNNTKIIERKIEREKKNSSEEISECCEIVARRHESMATRIDMITTITTITAFISSTKCYGKPYFLLFLSSFFSPSKCEHVARNKCFLFVFIIRVVSCASHWMKIIAPFPMIVHGLQCAHVGKEKKMHKNNVRPVDSTVLH